MHSPVLSMVLPVSLIALLAACDAPAPPSPPPLAVLIVHPQAATDLADAYPGEVRARFEPELAFRIDGKVSKRLVEVGQKVREGQPLAQLDPQDLHFQLDARRAQVAAAQANLRLVQAERDRYQRLLQRNMVSHSQFENVDNAYRAGEAQLRQATAQFNSARNQADYAVLRATQSGVIARRMLEVGQVVSAGRTVFSLAADGEREVLINLPEQAFERFRIGQPVSIELWSQPQRRFNGQIREMSPSADPRSRTFAARVTFTDNAVPVELGQSARVFIAHEASATLAVPLSALSAEANRPFVWVVDPQQSTLRRAFVSIGSFGEQQVAVLQGLAPDDWVVSAGVQVLREGQKVQPVDNQNRQVALAGKE
ncbi:efflux RND transporter periplasmic adaptor subunit [Pseudomonas sp. NPDC087612]|uniref:efflux RND transporter periplasmic adaptor subunit n=1 Tax=unclassified Pseudomonas TaxID=196821 RepID=UPI0024BFD311|nr:MULTISPECIES: efflux RND transporter periplasmic adaptor subunit [unclassified Pseudomonas]